MATIKEPIRVGKKSKSYKSKELISSQYLSARPEKIALPIPRHVPTSFGGIGQKTANISSATGVGLQGWLDGSANISTFAPEIMNPTLNPEMFFFPKFISVDGTPNIELNSWLWHYLRWDALTSNLVDLHSKLPISRFGLVGISDKKVLQFFEDNTDELNILETLQMMLFEWFGIGETALFGRWEKEKGKFVELKLLDPDYINVTGHYMLNSDHGELPEIYEYIPDEYLKTLTNADNPFERELVEETLDDEIRYAIENNYTLILDPFNFTLVRRKLRGRDLRGSSMLLNILKVLIIEDKLREQHYAMAKQNINPIRHWKIGSDVFMADDARMDGLESVIRQAQYDPMLNIITDHTVSLDIKGAVGTTDKMKDDYEWIENYKLTGLWANKAFVHSEGITYNSATIGMRVLMGRYLPIRSMFENIFYRKIFLPTSLAQDFYKELTPAQQGKPGVTPMVKPANKYRELLYPLFDWRHKQSLMDDQSVRSMLMELRSKTQISMKVICDTLDIDYAYNKDWLEKEMNTVFDPDIMESKKTVVNSAGAGALKDKGEGIIKRILDASSAFANSLIGYSPNIQVSETKESKEAEKDSEGGALEPPKSDNTEEDVLKQQRFFKTQYGAEQLASYASINKKYHDKALSDIKRVSNRKSAFDLNYGSKDLPVKLLKQKNYPQKVTETVRGQLNDLRILLGQASVNFIYKNESLKECINSVIQSLNSNYHQRLYNLNKYFSQATLNAFNSDKDVGECIVPDFEKIYSLKVDVDDLGVEDKNVRRAVWETIYPKLESQIVANLTDMYKTSELYTFAKLGVKNVYIDNVKTPIDKVAKEHLDSTIVPDTDMKVRRSLSFKKYAIKNCPIEMLPQVLRTVDKVGMVGEHDFSNIEEFSTSLYNDDMLKSYLTARYYSLDRNSMTDMFSKHYNMESDEIEWWVTHGMKTVYETEENRDIEEFVKSNL